MQKLFKNRVLYLSVSFLLLVASYPLISMGTTGGPDYLWWIGLVSLTLGAMIPPAQRIFFPPPKENSD